MLSKLLDEITYPLPNVNGATVEVYEWLINYTTQLIMGEIIYACWDLS